MTKLYAIRDTLAGALVGPVQTFKHDAIAVRFFGDVASQAGTSINQHVEQHELLCLGELDEESGQIGEWSGDANRLVVDEPVVVISGAAWKAAKEAQENRK